MTTQSSIILADTLRAWGTPGFDEALKRELAAVDAALLPLQEGLSQGGYALADSLSVMIISSAEDAGAVHVKAGLFYTSLIAGCSCADDPSPVEEQPEYCEVELLINRKTGLAAIRLVE